MVSLNTVNVRKFTKSGTVFEYSSEYQLWIGHCHNTDLSKPGVYDCWAVVCPHVVGWNVFTTDMVKVVSIGVTPIA